MHAYHGMVASPFIYFNRGFLFRKFFNASRAVRLGRLYLVNGDILLKISVKGDRETLPFVDARLLLFRG